MRCPKCGSNNVTVQVVSETQLLEKKHGVLWWVLVSWWWLPFKWLFLTLPAIIMKIFAPKKYRTKTKHISKCVCQNCGYHWNA